MLQAAVDDAGASFELEVRQTFNAGSSVVFEASGFHFFAISIVGHVEPTFAGNAAIVVIDLAVGNDTATVLEKVGFEAFEAAVIGLLEFAAEHLVVPALTKNQRIFSIALQATKFCIVLLAKLHSIQALPISKSKSVGAVGAFSCFLGQASDKL